MPNLILIRGIPGSGKSTFAKKFKNYKHIETDMYWGGRVFQGDKLKEAHSWCFDIVKTSLSLGSNVVVSNTFTQLWEMENYLSLTSGVLVFRMTQEYGSIHNVPESTMNKMRNRFEDYEGEILVA